jgi:hypothetical protein
VHSDTGMVAAKCSVVLTSLPPRTGIAPLDEVVGTWPRPLWLITGPRGCGRSVPRACLATLTFVWDRGLQPRIPLYVAYVPYETGRRELGGRQGLSPGLWLTRNAG